MFRPELGAVFLTSPTYDVLGYTLLAVGLVAGLFLKFNCPFQNVGAGAMLYAAHRDFGIPLEVLLIAAVPVYCMRWDGAKRTNLALTVGYIVNYVLAREIEPPRHAYTPAVAAALYVGSSENKVHAAAIVLARHLAPRAVHMLYGIPFFRSKEVHFSYYDSVAGLTLALTLFAMMAMEWWFHYFLVAVGVLSFLVYK